MRYAAQVVANLKNTENWWDERETEWQSTLVMALPRRERDRESMIGGKETATFRFSCDAEIYCTSANRPIKMRLEEGVNSASHLDVTQNCYDFH